MLPWGAMLYMNFKWKMEPSSIHPCSHTHGMLMPIHRTYFTDRCCARHFLALKETR